MSASASNVPKRNKQGHTTNPCFFNALNVIPIDRVSSNVIFRLHNKKNTISTLDSYAERHKLNELGFVSIIGIP